MPSEQFKLNWTAIGVVGGFIINIAGWFIVHLLTKRREALRDQRSRADAAAAANRQKTDDKKLRDEQSRTNFRGVICGFKAQVVGIDNWGFQDWYKSMQIEVERQCAIVESAIDCRYRSCFDAARQECAKQQTQRDLMDDRAPFAGLPMGLDRLPEVTYQRGRKRASTVLDSLLDVCK
jgi:hypothetical protein